MALQVWLPLLGDLHNQGLDSSGSFGSSTAFATNGKIGGKSGYSNIQKTATFSSLVNITNFSFAYWIKVDSSIAVQRWADILGFDVTTTNNSAIIRDEFTATAGRHQILMGKDTTVGSNTNNYVGTGASSSGALDKWTHYAVIKNDINTYVYTNGVLTNTIVNSNFESAPQKLTGKIYLGNTSSTAAQINDFRVYDHCLSPMEVKKLSQGLVLHYPLNRQGWGQENLVTGSNTNSLSTNNWAIGSRTGGNTRTIEQDETGTYCVKFVRDSTTQSGWYFLRYGNLLRNQIKTDTTYTLTFDCKASVNSSITFIGLLNVNATNYMTNSTTNIQSSVVANQWCHMKYQCKTISSFDDITIGSQVVYLVPQAALKAVGVTVYFKNIKLEEGSIATPWCPNSSDALATTMGLNSTTEYDCSGFCNNGTWHGTHTNTSDTPKYAVSTTATGSGTTYLEGPVLPAEAKTVALWIKNTNKSSNGAIFNDKTSGLQIGLLNSLLYMNSATSTAGFTTTHWVNGEWNHVVAINNNGTRSLYVNGQAETQSGASNYYIHNADNCWLWNRSYNNSYPFTGSLCDLRVYATALSADDVKSLYQNCATIDPDGTIRGQIRD